MANAKGPTEGSCWRHRGERGGEQSVVENRARSGALGSLATEPPPPVLGSATDHSSSHALPPTSRKLPPTALPRKGLDLAQPSTVRLVASRHRHCPRPTTRAKPNRHEQAVMSQRRRPSYEKVAFWIGDLMLPSHGLHVWSSSLCAFSIGLDDVARLQHLLPRPNLGPCLAYRLRRVERVLCMSLTGDGGGWNGCRV